MVDINNLPEGTPVWVTITLILVFASLMVVRQLKDLKGPVGALSRWWEGKAVREIQKKKTLALEADDLVDTRVNLHLEPVLDQLKSLQRQVRTLRDELDTERKERREERATSEAEHLAEIKMLEDRRVREVKGLKDQAALMWAYITEAATYHRRLYLWAISEDVSPPPPHPYPDYYQWLDNK